LKIGTSAAYFQRAEKFCCAKLRLKTNSKTSIKISEKHFITNARIIIRVYDHL
jgi:hypothetical protein